MTSSLTDMSRHLRGLLGAAPDGEPTMSRRAAFTGDVLTRESCRAAGLLRDDRGVIMVVGVMFMLLWIGLAWAIFGIGNAIAYRENLQNAADASAFAAAVYDARGMNMLASINIIMGVVLAVLIAAHIVQIIALIALGIDCWSCIPDIACGYGWASCPGDCSDQSEANSIVEDVDTVVHDILPILHDLEVGVAVGWPWVASGKSTSLGGTYYSRGVAVTSTFAWSQIPWSGEQYLSSITDNFGGFSGVSGDANTDNTRYGLPVSSDKYSHLCDVAFIDVTNLGGLISMPGFITQFLAKAGAWFCDAGSESSTPTDIIEGVSCLVLPCAIYGPFDPTPSLSDSWDTGSSTSVKDKDTSQSPMMIFPDAKMGYDYYGIWSTAIGVFSDVTTSKVQVAGQQSKQSGSAKLVGPVPSDTLLGIAKSEFYYDPIPGDSKDQETSIGDNWPIRDVMWNLRWRARLRRYHYIPGILGDLDAIMNLNFNKAAAAAAKGLVDGDTISQIVASVMGSSGGDVTVNTYKNKPTPGVFH
jgi:hypothetical protein